MKKENNEHYMKAALQEAKKAFDADEIPIGAVIVCNEQIIARAHNMTEKLNDVTAHAEMIAFTSASSFLNSKYLNECTLYVTIEPCLMCAGASYWTQLSKIVFGAYDEKRGYSKCKGLILHPKTKIVSGVLEKECAELMRDFFEKKR
ncbi:MAG: nucleoside deaminase [Bacteroidota bacterium]